MRTLFKTTFSMILSLSLLMGMVSLWGNPTKASVALATNATVSGDTVTVTVSFPDVVLASVSVEVAFNTAHLKMSAEPTHTVPAGPFVVPTPMATANGQGKCTLAVAGATDLSFNGVKMTLVFHVENAEVESTTVTATVTKAVKSDQTPVSLGGTSKEITLKTVTPPPPVSSDTSGSVSSGTTDGEGTVDTSVTSNTNTNTNTNSSDTSDKPTSSTKTSSSISSDKTSDTGTVTDSIEVSDTDSAVSSTETETQTDLPLTDGTSEGTLPQSSDSATATSSSTSSPSLGTQVIRTEGNGDSGVSTDTVVLLVSIAVACFLCFCLTYLGLRRQTPKNPDEE